MPECSYYRKLQSNMSSHATSVLEVLNPTTCFQGHPHIRFAQTGKKNLDTIPTYTQKTASTKLLTSYSR